MIKAKAIQFDGCGASTVREVVIAPETALHVEDDELEFVSFLEGWSEADQLIEEMRRSA